MKNILLAFSCLLFFPLAKSEASTLPDSLRNKLNAVQGQERLHVWIDWYDNFSKLLAKYRWEKAKKMLSQPGQSVAEVAFAVGFSDPNYFSKAYKKHFDVAPTQYQR